MKTKLYLIALSWLMISNAAQAQFETVAQITTQKGDPHAIHFVNENLGFACGEEAGRGVMYKTINGGNDWTKFYTSEDELHWILDIFFVDENIGFALKQNGIYGSVLKTTNGGEDGTEYNLPSYRGRSMYFLSADKGFIVGGVNGSEIDGEGTGVLYKTTNGGQSWEVVSLPNTSTYYHHISYFNKIHFVNSQLGFIAGDNSLFVTKDGGDNWINVSDNYREWNPDENRYGFPFPNSFTGVNESVWFTACSSGIRKTTNGGETWQWATLPEIPSGYRFSVFDVKFVNSTVGIAVGGYIDETFTDAHGVILKTTDGGNTWVKLDNEYEIWGRDIHFVNDQTGYFIGFGWVIKKTTNAGGEYLSISENKEWNNHSSVFPNPSNNIIYFENSVFENSVAQVKIYSLDGQLIESLTVNESEPKVDISSLTNGIYLLEVKSGKNSFKQKIMKN